MNYHGGEVAEGGIERREFEGYIRRHEDDRFAHAAMRDNFSQALLGTADAVERRITALERWQQRMIGALMLLSFLLVSGAATLGVQWLRR